MEVPSIFLNRILSEMVQKNGSDLHLAVGSPPIIRINGQFVPLAGQKMVTSEMINKITETFLDLDEIVKLKETKGVNLVKNISKFRFRVNVFYQKGLLALSFHYIPGAIKSFNDLGLVEVCRNFLQAASGLLIIAGAANSGKTTTAAAFIEELNKTKVLNIVTIEDPIEYLFVSKTSLVMQRQIGVDVNTVADALDYCLSEDMDVVYINEIKDNQVFNSVMPKIFELASGNCLVVLEINADSSNRVLEKVLAGMAINLPTEAARYNLADILIGILVQKLVKRRGGGLVLANEILLNNASAKSLIREGKIYQLESVMQTSRKEGMISMNKSLNNLIESGEVRREDI
ncbi:Flp pilus assembly complex ATPase component TadA [Patescibacteria group bacterium]|nr:Flp pilus assembly complex ATPase component TadA [Patescibacteria group bacterium]MBU1663289.1 Flp pilus assembly complex ATPase component TadA [Patescibacteria group bacterium]MBU1933849.1 Flp pilus assembly complex ATPase component TadA [Patescibacteria group bacterium]MBU2007946.1 Flp pilus assembly complex ATPase component TadA [Patescibacteria group bacterium]MBU2233812.1 Flp pilus assembly complex ATPase component TadA [Patescibacteria group bacterium]